VVTLLALTPDGLLVGEVPDGNRKDLRNAVEDHDGHMYVPRRKRTGNNAPTGAPPGAALPGAPPLIDLPGAA